MPYRQARGTLLIILIPRRRLGKPQIPSTQEQATSQQHTENSSPKPKRKALAHRYKNYEHSTEGEHRTAEQYTWRWGIVLNVLIFFVAVIGATFAYKTYEQTRRQADIQQATLVAIKEPDVHFAGLKDLHESPPDIPPNSVASAVQWKNDGGGGTRRLRWLTACAVGASLNQAISAIDVSREVIVLQPDFLSAGQESGGGRCIVQKTDISRINAGQATLFLYGEARYFGKFDPKKLKITEFTFASHHIDLVNNEISADFIGVGDRNCQDEDCPNYPKLDKP